MSQSLLQLSSDKQHDMFIDLSDFLKRLGFELVYPKELALERRSMKISKPTRKRQEEGDGCPVFRKPFMSGYFLEVIPRFNKETKTFTQHGQVTVQVKTIYKHKRVFGIYFKKWDGMKDRVETVTGFLVNVLLKHPRTDSGEYMILQRSEKNKWNIYFSDPDSPKSISKRKKILSEEFLDRFPAKKKEVLDIFNGRIEYVANKPKDVQDLSGKVHRRTVKKGSKSAVSV